MNDDDSRKTSLKYRVYDKLGRAFFDISHLESDGPLYVLSCHKHAKFLAFPAGTSALNNVTTNAWRSHSLIGSQRNLL